MKIRLLITAILTVSMLNSAEASVRTSPQDSLIYTRTMQELLPYAGLPAGELMVKTAGMFYGTPYKGGTLETVPEALTVNLHETDCILLVETCTAMTILLKGCTDGGIPSFEDFCAMLRTLRYRDGITDGYPSRLHYTSEWLLQAQDNGFLKEVTAELGGIPLNQVFSFMSSHRDNYPRLREDDGALELIRRAEERLDTAAACFYIPSEKIPEIEHLFCKHYLRTGHHPYGHRLPQRGRQPAFYPRLHERGEGGAGDPYPDRICPQRHPRSPPQPHL